MQEMYTRLSSVILLGQGILASYTLPTLFSGGILDIIHFLRAKAKQQSMLGIRSM